MIIRYSTLFVSEIRYVIYNLSPNEYYKLQLQNKESCFP